MLMKTYRIITLLVAVLITASLAEVLSHEKVGDPNAQPSITMAGAP
jgi:hypothetical protein